MATKRKKAPSKRKGPYDRRSTSRHEERDDAQTTKGYVADTEKHNTFGGNAIEWYSRYPQLLLGAGQIPYPYRPGMTLPLGKFYNNNTDVVNNTTIPGLLRIDWIPSVGQSDSPTSPISIVGKEVYAKVREKFSGSLDADAPDFVIY